MHTLAKRLRYAREQVGLSQSALARAVGLQPQAVQSIEAGRVQQPRQIAALAEALAVSAAWLATGEGAMAPLGVRETSARYSAGAPLSAEALELARSWMALPQAQRQAMQATIRALEKPVVKPTAKKPRRRKA